METSKEKYIRLEKESGFKVGDKVLVTAEFVSGQFGWANTAVVTGINDGVQYEVKQLASDQDEGWGILLIGDGDGDDIWYPFFVLERVMTEEEEEKTAADIIASLGLEETKI